MCRTASATTDTSISGSASGALVLTWVSNSVAALPMSIWPQAMPKERPSSDSDLVSPVTACLDTV